LTKSRKFKHLNRTQPRTAAHKKGERGQTMTHDYEAPRYEPRCFARFDVTSPGHGHRPNACRAKPGQGSSLRYFGASIGPVTSSKRTARTCNLVLDNYATTRRPRSKLGLEKHPRFKLHFTRQRSARAEKASSNGFSPRSVTQERIRRGSYPASH